MIKIGDFAKLAHVSIKTLHHYGELGLLLPAHVDRYNGYRFYTLEQLTKLNRILALKELGFSLEQIIQLLNEQIGVAEMRGMLRLKQLELSANITAEQNRLASVEHRLHRLELDGKLPQSEVAIKSVPAQTVITAKAVAATESLVEAARSSLHELLSQHLANAHLKTSGPWFSILTDRPYSERDLEIELAVPISTRNAVRQGDWGVHSPVSWHELPPTSHMASLMYQGEPYMLPDAYTHLYAWTQTHGYRADGAYREVYLSDFDEIPTQARKHVSKFIELQCPVRRAQAPISVQSSQTRKDQIMQPQILTKPAFKAVGMSYVGKNEQNEIAKMWGVFNQRCDEIPSVNSICYGLCFSRPEGAAEGEFEYVAATEVSDQTIIPEGMVYREVPEYRYAVFTHKGKLDTLGETYKFIYETWLPQSGIELHHSKYDMELYDERFIPDSDDSEFDIYVALK